MWKLAKIGVSMGRPLVLVQRFGMLLDRVWTLRFVMDDKKCYALAVVLAEKLPHAVLSLCVSMLIYH